MGVLLVDDQDAGGDAGAVEQIGWQADDPLDEATPDKILSDVGFLVATEQYAVRQNDRALAFALERRNEMQEEGVVAVLGRGDAVFEAPVLVVSRIETAGLGLGGEGRIGDGKVEGLEAAILILEVRSGQRISVP